MRFKRIWLSLLFVALLLIGGTVSAQDGTLTALDTLLAQAENALDNNDLATAQALFTGANAIITDEVTASCPALLGARSILTEASTASDIATARALSTSVRTLLDTCLSAEGSGNNTQGATQGQPQGAAPQGQPAGAPQGQQAGAPQGQPQESGNSEGQPQGATASGTAPASLPVITADNVDRIDILYRIGDGLIQTIELSPDGATAAVSGYTGIWLFDAYDLNAEPRLISLDRPQSIAWSPDGTTIAAVVKSHIELVDVASGTVRATLAVRFFGHGILSLDWSPDGRQIMFTTGKDGTWLWNLDDETPRVIEDGYSNPSSWSPDGSKIAVGSTEGTIRIYDGQSAALLQTLQHPVNETVLHIVWAPDSQRFLTDYHNSNLISIWHVASGAEVQSIEIPLEAYITDMAWSSNGYGVAISTSSWNANEDIILWDLPTNTFAGEIETGMTLYDVVWRKDGRLLATYTDQVYLIDPSTSQILANYQFDYIQSDVTWSPDGQQFAVALSSGENQIRQAANGDVLRTFANANHDAFNRLRWSPDGRYIAGIPMPNILTEIPTTLYIWDAITGAQLVEINNAEFDSLTWSEDGAHLVSYDRRNKTMFVWQAGTWALYNTITLDPENRGTPHFINGSILAVQNGDTLELYDIHSGTQARAAALTNINDNSADAITGYFSPNSRRLAVSTSSGINVYSVASGYDYLYTWDSGERAIFSWSPDSQLVALTHQFTHELAFFADFITEPIMTHEHSDTGGEPVWSPDGSRIARSSSAGWAHIYGVQD